MGVIIDARADVLETVAPDGAIRLGQLMLSKVSWRSSMSMMKDDVEVSGLFVS
jgi:hypothetical protein